MKLTAATKKKAMSDRLRRYPGGKNGAGIYQRLISLMPPHTSYVEAFLGSGAILRRKLPAVWSVGIDLDPEVIAKHRKAGLEAMGALVCADAVGWLRLCEEGGGVRLGEQTLIYADPPYLGDARCEKQRALYRHEMLSDEAHEELLQILTTIPAMVMISGYRHPLYDARLRGWTRIDYQAMTRGGLKPESVWMNYPLPSELHDYRYLGDDFHDRCRIKRKLATWVRRLRGLPTLERAAIMHALSSIARFDAGKTD